MFSSSYFRHSRTFLVIRLLLAKVTVSATLSPQKLTSRIKLQQQALYSKANQAEDGRTVQGLPTTPIHYVLTTDCTAYNLWQGHVHAALLERQQPGQRLTWLASGCTLEEQQAMFQKVVHPNAQVRFFENRHPRDPKTGEELADFQASNRPIMVRDWVSKYPTDLLSDEVVILSEPDQYMLHPMLFSGAPLTPDRKDVMPSVSWSKRPGLTDYIQPGRAAAQDAAAGAKWYSLSEQEVRDACGPNSNCTSLSRDEAEERYGSGPPWALHSSDLRSLSQLWEGLMVSMKRSKAAAFESEQTAFGMATAALGIDSVLYKHYTVSTWVPGSEHFEGWNWIGHKDSYDPCATQALPDKDAAFIPNFLHMCSTVHSEDHVFTLHKDHVPKDILECAAPLLKHPPADLLIKQVNAAGQSGGPMPEGIKHAWTVCAFTNAVNAGVELFKKQNCRNPNLERTYIAPSHAESFLWSDNNETVWHLPKYFHKGGWSDNKNAPIHGTPAIF